LAEFPRVIGIKDSSGDLAFMMRMIASVRPNRPDFSFLTGWEAVLAPMLLVGADGGTNASSNVVPEITRKIYELCRAGKYDEAMQFQYHLTELFDAMLFPFEFPDGFRAGAELRGFRFGRPRQHFTDSQLADRCNFRNGLQGILAHSFGLTDAPLLECPPRTGQFDKDQIAQVVADVLSALEKRGVF
jgi:4-hydroxy-tetrahydrodipicolinate synthase